MSKRLLDGAPPAAAPRGGHDANGGGGGGSGAFPADKRARHGSPPAGAVGIPTLALHDVGGGGGYPAPGHLAGAHGGYQPVGGGGGGPPGGGAPEPCAGPPGYPAHRPGQVGDVLLGRWGGGKA